MQDNEITIKQMVINLQAWASYLFAKWKIFVIAGILGGILGLFYSVLQTPLYSATTTFVLESGDTRSNLGRLAGVAAIAGLDLGPGSSGLFQGDNILELYRSRTMIVQTLLSKTHPDTSELLIDRYIAFNELKERWKDNPILSDLDFSVSSEQLGINEQRVRDSVLTKFANDIRENLLIVDKPSKKLSIIQVDVVSPDEIFSKSFNDILVSRVNDFYIQTKTQKTTTNIALLEAKVDSVRRVMEGAIYSAARIADATPNLNPTRQSQRVVPVQGAQFSAEANRVMLSQLLQNLELARMTLAQEQPLIQLVDRPVYPLPVVRVGKLKAIIIGIFLVGFLTLAFLVIQKWYRDIMA